MQINIIKKAKTVLTELLIAGLVVWTTTAPVQADSGTPATTVTSQTATNDKGETVEIKQLASNPDSSSTYRKQTTAEQISSAFSYEERMGKKAVDRAYDNLMSGNISGAVGSITKFASAVTGDVLNAGLDAVGNVNDAYWDAVDDVAGSVAGWGCVGKFVADYVLKPSASVGRFITDTAINLTSAVVTAVFGGTNYQCRQEKMDNIYKSGCYPCKVISSLIGAFLSGCSYFETVSLDAGRKILILGFCLWIAFYLIQQLSSLRNIEPASMVNDLLIMAFKVLCAWAVISFGFTVAVNYILVPLLNWGLDFGTTILVSATSVTGLDISGNQVDTSYMLGSSYGGLIPSSLLNNIMTYVGAVDGTVTNHMKLGHMLICHSTHAGRWEIEGLSIPNLWIFLCGAAIWFMGFMMTLSVLYYLIDMSFKLGFSLIALPIVIGLWPFGVTRDKFKACVSIILNAAGIFIFLAMTTAVGLVLVDKAIGVNDLVENGGSAESLMSSSNSSSGVQALYEEIEEGDNEKISDRFMLWSTGFIILVFAYLYAMKIIGSTNDDYVNQFFSDSVFDKLQPMHSMLTAHTDMVLKSGFKNTTKYASDVISHQGKQLTNVLGNKFFGGDDDQSILDSAQNVEKQIDNLQKGKFDEDSKEETGESSKLDSALNATNMKGRDAKSMESAESGKSDNGENAATQAMEAAGEGLTEAGKAVKEASKASADAIKQTGNTVDGIGSAAAVPTLGTSKAVTTVAKVGTEASAAAVEISGKIAGETMITAGKVLKKTAKVMKKTNKMANKMKKALKKAKKAGKTAKKALNNIQQRMNDQNNSSNSEEEENKSGNN